ncbi:MAG: hypothetical protein L3J12_07545 [Spirochaetales bacterium]|nr:hypothetical protein [Spirochaetales bacterium]
MIGKVIFLSIGFTVASSLNCQNIINHDYDGVDLTIAKSTVLYDMLKVYVPTAPA